MADRILVITDEPISRHKIISVLAEAGFTVGYVPDYREALKLEIKPDIAIMDAILPEREVEACHQLHSTLGIPVVLLGEDSSDEAWERVMEADVDLYLVRPFSHLELVARVRAILRRYKRLPGKKLIDRWHISAS